MKKQEQHWNFTTAEKEEMRRLRSEGWGLRRVAKLFGCTHPMVDYHCNRRRIADRWLNTAMRTATAKWPTKKQAAQRGRYRKHREKILANTKEYRSQYPERKKARDAVRTAVAHGRMPRADSNHCAECGGRAKEYHHWSYLPKHALDVIPLCDPCHKMVHREDDKRSGKPKDHPDSVRFEAMLHKLKGKAVRGKPAKKIATPRPVVRSIVRYPEHCNSGAK